MNYQLLAIIDNNRQIMHDAGQVVYIHWDTHQFRLMRSNFSQFARVLEDGAKRLYAGKNPYSVVQVDDDLREVWIENTCLSLTRREYRALLNATLTTETRLNGFSTLEQQDEEVCNTLSAFYHAPRPIAFNWN